MVSARVRKFVVHGTRVSGDITGAPWTVEMQATKRLDVLG